jgi:hypothetical protein
MKDLYIANQDRYHGIIHFLQTAARYWEDEGENPTKAQEGWSYVRSIKDQRPMAPGPYEMEVADGISQFARDSAQGVDFMAWEVDEVPESQRGDMSRAQRTLANL